VKKVRGFTLVEMVVVIIICSVIFGMLTPLLQSGFDSFFTQQKLVDADWQGRLALERMSRDIRAIPASTSISLASATQLTFIDSTSNTVAYQVVGNNLLLNTNILAEGISSLLFQYYDGNGAVTATVANIRYVKITLNITHNNTNYVLQTVINPRNVS
jgi:prepilin-type N-terminal cleavage/methylation domain-containing protein